jgi:hypothetical protein
LRYAKELSVQRILYLIMHRNFMFGLLLVAGVAAFRRGISSTVTVFRADMPSAPFRAMP